MRVAANNRSAWGVLVGLAAVSAAALAGAASFDISRLDMSGTCAPLLDPIGGAVIGGVVAVLVVAYLWWEFWASAGQPPTASPQKDGKLVDGLRHHAFAALVMVLLLLAVNIGFARFDELLQSLHVPGGSAIGILAATDAFATPDVRGTRIVDGIQSWFAYAGATSTQPGCDARSILGWLLALDTFALVPAYVVLFGLLIGLGNRLIGRGKLTWGDDQSSIFAGVAHELWWSRLTLGLLAAGAAADWLENWLVLAIVGKSWPTQESYLPSAIAGPPRSHGRRARN